ncbi:MAG: allantoinase [Actinomycetota bacterium]|nr:allantoinase [Actinomycetota bacterium]
MGELDLVVRARRAVLEGTERAVSVGVRDGVVVELAAYDAPPGARQTVELAADEVLLPGLVDTHVHINEPGRTEWEGFRTATRAAAAGGVTTLVDMPLNSIPPTTSVQALDVKRAAAREGAHVDVGFWGGIVPENLDQLAGLHDAGVMGFKAFLLPSGVEEFPHVSYGQLRRALELLAPLGALTVVHAEDPDVIDHAAAATGPSYAGFLASRPQQAEDQAVARLVDLARDTGARVHVLHLSSATALPAVAAAQAEGLAVTAETCPHYLGLSAEEVPDGATPFKCCPPIRGTANRNLLWEGLRQGVLTCVVSDHSPCTPDLKQLATGDFGLAWGGIASLQLGLPLVWTEARRRAVPLTEVVQWMSRGPADLVGLGHKGRIAAGAAADLVAFAPDQDFTVEADRLEHRNPVTPYAGRRLTGVVRRTWLRGTPTDSDGPRDSGEARGRLLVRQP